MFQLHINVEALEKENKVIREENAAKQYLFTILKTKRGARAKISPVSIVFYEEGRMRGRVRSLVERTMREIISGCLVGGWATGPVGLPPLQLLSPKAECTVEGLLTPSPLLHLHHVGGYRQSAQNSFHQIKLSLGQFWW